MPTYSYACASCGHAFECVMSVREKETLEVRCPACGGTKVEQQILGFSVSGSGGGPAAPGG